MPLASGTSLGPYQVVSPLGSGGMSFALFIAAGSFFSIRARVAKVLPEPFLGGGVRAFLALFPLLAMLYWLWRIRGGRAQRWLGGVPARAT